MEIEPHPAVFFHLFKGYSKRIKDATHAEIFLFLQEKVKWADKFIFFSVFEKGGVEQEKNAIR